MGFYKEDFHQRLYRYALRIVRFTERLPRDNVGRIIGAQLLRSGTSITSNIIEAKSASSKRDYINFYTHALKSANESIFWLSLLRDAGKVEQKEAAELLNETGEVAKILGASVVTMKKSIPRKI